MQDINTEYNAHHTKHYIHILFNVATSLENVYYVL